MAQLSGFFSQAQFKNGVSRVFAHLALAGIALTVPAVGANRYLLAGLLICVVAPLALLVNRYAQGSGHSWADPLVDLLMLITLIHLVPHLWMVGMALGLMIAVAPSLSLHPASHWVYLFFGVLLVGGMTLAAVVHGAQDWELVIAAVVVCYPALLFYTFTQMRRANDLRKRAEMMRGMTQMAGSVAHDFNNMLTSIAGYTELALARNPADPESRKALENVLQGTERAAVLCEQLLSFAGRDGEQISRIDVGAETTLIVELLTPVLPQGTRVSVHGGAQPLYINARLSDLHQVLMNVILNAGESMNGGGGEVEVYLRSTVPEPGQMSGRIECLVCDRGRGIPGSEVSKVFDPFFSTKSSGHGLGLASIKRTLHDMDGDIHIRPRQGGGTVVAMSWPLAVPLNLTGEATTPA